MMVKSDKCMGVSQLLGEHVPGLPTKSTPMYSMHIGQCTFAGTIYEIIHV